MEPRNFKSGASASPPTAPITPSNGYPTEGNPSTGTPATLPGAFWFHKIGEELRAAIVGAGLTPSDSSLNQLAEAINPGASLLSSGYQKLPSGLIMQWGYGTSSGTTANNCVVSLPMAFPNAALTALACVTGSNQNTFGIQLTSLTTATATFSSTVGTYYAGIAGFTYIAIGH